MLRSVLTSEIVVMALFSQRNLKWECLDFTDGTSTDAIVGISAVVSSFLLTLYNRKPFWEDSSLAGDFLIKQGLTFYYVQYYGSSRGREFSSSTVVIIQFNLFLFVKRWLLYLCYLYSISMSQTRQVTIESYVFTAFYILRYFLKLWKYFMFL